MADVNTIDLRDFIEREMKARGMSANQFAEFIGVAHTTINRARDPRNPTTPSPELLYKLAQKTGVNLSTLIAIIMPEVEQTPVDAKTLARAERIGKLPPDKQEAIDDIILGMALNKSE